MHFNSQFSFTNLLSKFFLYEMFNFNFSIQFKTKIIIIVYYEYNVGYIANKIKIFTFYLYSRKTRKLYSQIVHEITQHLKIAVVI